MGNLLTRAVESFVADLEPEKVYADFLLLHSEFFGPGKEWDSPPKGGKLGELTFQGQNWVVVWCDSELNLRREALRAPESKAVLLFLGGEDPSVLPDIRARSHRSMVNRLGLRHLLAAETGRKWPREVDYDDWRPTILRHRKALVDVAGKQLLDVSRDELDVLLVEAAFGLDLAGVSSDSLVVQLCLQHVR